MSTLIKKKIKDKICVVGLGYVGIPLALSLASKKFTVVGFDINKKKIEDLKILKDETNEAKKYGINNLRKVYLTSNPSKIASSNIFIITVPTPVNKKNDPDLKLLKNATKFVAKNLKSNDLVIFESTVYPNTTEGVCVPILEKYSKLTYKNKGNEKILKNNFFYCGYSPERINPGDKKNTLQNITKIISGSTNIATKKIKNIYKNICESIFVAKSIKVAEAAKIIENTQRDVNIALINEFQSIFNKSKINIYDILKAAETKWNFVKFEPGFVGGHCVGIDPYYLAYSAIKNGHNPKLILAGRKINSNVPKSFFNKIKNKIISNIKKKNVSILFMGASFKENCNDIRNSKVLELAELLNKSFKLTLFDKIVDYGLLKKNSNCKIIKSINKKRRYDCIIIANKHDYIREMGLKNIKKKLKNGGLIFDLKNLFNLYNDIL